MPLPGRRRETARSAQQRGCDVGDEPKARERFAREAANLARVLPAGLVADVNRSSWVVPPVFDMVRRLGEVPWDDLEGTLNLGVGMIAVVDRDRAEAAARVVEVAPPALRLGGDGG